MAHEHDVDTVQVGTWVKVVQDDSGEHEVFHIVESPQTDYLENRIPPENPVGRALMGSQMGEEVAINGPKGKVKFTVMEMGRE